MLEHGTQVQNYNSHFLGSHQPLQRGQGWQVLKVSMRVCLFPGVVGNVNVPEALHMVLDHIVANPNPDNLRFWTAEIDHCRAPSVIPKLDKPIIDNDICNIENLLVDVVDDVLGP